MLTTASNDYPEDIHSMMSSRLPSNISLETPVSPSSGHDFESNISFLSTSRQNMRSVSQAQMSRGDNSGLNKKSSMYDITQQYRQSRTSLLKNSPWPPRSASSYNIQKYKKYVSFEQKVQMYCIELFILTLLRVGLSFFFLIPSFLKSHKILKSADTIFHTSFRVGHDFHP